MTETASDVMPPRVSPVQTDDTIMNRVCHTPGGDVDGENTSLQDGNSHDSAQRARANPHGDVEAEAESSVDRLRGDEPAVKIAAILETWEANAVGQDYAPSTKTRYASDFRRFAKDINLEVHNRVWLRDHGQEAVIAWIMALPEKSRAPLLAGVQSVWSFGIPDVAWPVTKRRDFGRKVFTKPDSRACPEDTDIAPIFRAAQREDDLYLKSLVLVALNEGGRPGNQLGQLRWSDIRECGNGLAIVAESKPGRKFKSKAAIVARLPPIASDALRAWKAKTPFNGPDDYIWPRRKHGEMVRTMSDDHTMAREWHTFLHRHQIVTWVRVANLRHWTEYRGEQDGVPQILLAFMRGHSVKAATEGALGYSSNRKVPKVLEDQEQRWPEGATGRFTASEVMVVDKLAPYMAIITEYEKGQMTTAEAGAKLEGIRLGLRNRNPDIAR